MSPYRSKASSRKKSARKQDLTHSLPVVTQALPDPLDDDDAVPKLSLRMSRFRVQAPGLAVSLPASKGTPIAPQGSHLVLPALHHDNVTDSTFFGSSQLDMGGSTLFLGSYALASRPELPELEDVGNLTSDLSISRDRDPPPSKSWVPSGPPILVPSSSIIPQTPHSKSSISTYQFTVPWQADIAKPRSKFDSSLSELSTPSSSSSSFNSFSLITPSTSASTRSPLILTPASSSSVPLPSSSSSSGRLLDSDSFRFLTPLTPASKRGTSNSPILSTIGHLPDPRTRTLSRAARIHAALETLHDGRLSPADLLISVLDPANGEYEGYRNEMYKDESTKLRLLIDTIMDDPKGKRKLEDLIAAHATDLTCRAVNTEMEAIKKKLNMTVSDITPEFIAGWDINGNEALELTPTLLQVLSSAAQSSYSAEKNKIKSPETVSRMRSTGLLLF
jgi:hypothetical protein